MPSGSVVLQPDTKHRNQVTHKTGGGINEIQIQTWNDIWIEALKDESVEKQTEITGEQFADIAHAESFPDGDFSADCQQAENYPSSPLKNGRFCPRADNLRNPVGHRRYQ